MSRGKKAGPLHWKTFKDKAKHVNERVKSGETRETKAIVGKPRCRQGKARHTKVRKGVAKEMTARNIKARQETGRPSTQKSRKQKEAQK